MKTFLLILSSFASFFALSPALAIDPGVVQGSLQVGGSMIKLTHAYAHLHDNAEKLLDRPRELRILLADREAPQSTLVGIAFLSAKETAHDGKLRGLLIQMDPDDRRQAVITLLYPPTDRAHSVTTISLGGSADVVRNLSMANNRVGGEIESGPRDASKVEYRAKFSAPLFNEPAITADLNGKAAHDSPQVRVLRERARAITTVDLEALRRISSARAYSMIEDFLKDAGAREKAYAREIGTSAEEQLKNVQRVVVRGDRAVVIFSPDEWLKVVLERGEWRSDD